MEDIRWKYIELLSELRADYSCFDEKEEPYYRALSFAIKSIREQEEKRGNKVGWSSLENVREKVEQIINGSDDFIKRNADYKIAEIREVLEDE